MKPEIWLCPDRLFDGGTLLEGRALGVAAGGSTIVALLDNLPPEAEKNVIKGTIVPGFLDLQVNGGGDVLFNTTPTAAGIATIAAAHRRFGTVGILATVITDAPDVLAKAVDAALAAKGQAGFLGIHIEGPHLSVARRGTHRAEFIRPMDDATLAHVARLRQADVTVMITVAPEAITPAQIAALAATGAVVSIGHSDTDAATVRQCLSAGARCFTHLFNAMSPMLNRTPGVTGAAINSTAYSGIICDGIHVADEMVGLALRARPVADRTFLVSDAMSTVGGSDHFRLYGDEIRLVHGRLVNAEGSLAGAHITMAESLARLIGVVGIAPETALRMTSTVQAELLGRPELARLTARNTADLLVLDDDWHVCGTVAEALSVDPGRGRG